MMSDTKEPYVKTGKQVKISLFPIFISNTNSNHKAGTCIIGIKCHFAHGQEEIRNPTLDVINKTIFS